MFKEKCEGRTNCQTDVISISLHLWQGIIRCSAISDSQKRENWQQYLNSFFMQKNVFRVTCHSQWTLRTSKVFVKHNDCSVQHFTSRPEIKKRNTWYTWIFENKIKLRKSFTILSILIIFLPYTIANTVVIFDSDYYTFHTIFT